MPGMAEISALHASLLAGNPRERTLLPLPLHSSIANSDQLSVFQKPPNGLRKVVIATNIAYACSAQRLQLWKLCVLVL